MKSSESDGTPRLSPRLSPHQLWIMANEPDWRPWMPLIVNHRNAWPELRAWHALASREGYDAAGPAPAPPATKTGMFARLLRPATPIAPLPPATTMQAAPMPSPEPPRETDIMPQTHPPVTPQAAETEESMPLRDGLEAVADAPTPVLRIPWKPVMTVLAAVLAAALLATAGTTAWIHASRSRAERAAMETASTDCDTARKKATEAAGKLATATDKANATLKTVAGKDVKDTATVSRLETALKTTRAGTPAACKADGGAAALNKAARMNRTMAKAMESTTGRITELVSAVDKSKLDKTVETAQQLLKDSDGKVQDPKTRDELSKAIKARDADKIAVASKKVNDSVKAKEKADEEAKLKAEETESQRNQDSTAQSTTPGQTYVPTQGQSTTPRQNSVTPSTPQQSGSDPTPSWDVPAPSDPDQLPDMDPSM